MDFGKDAGFKKVGKHCTTLCHCMLGRLGVWQDMPGEIPPPKFCQSDCNISVALAVAGFLFGILHSAAAER